ncbi:MAG: hypothetical protein ACOY3P_24745 [Planctomycetota bacterium]
MAKEIDVYREWLGVTETARPLNHYQLFRLKTFEDDTSKIRDRYRQMNAHVRKFATGDYARQSQQLLNELAKAMLCLTDSQRKREYDATLGRQDAGPGRRRTLEEILLAQKAIDQAQLAKARSYAQAVGLEIRDALVQQKMAPADVVTLAYAESIGLPYVDLSDVGVDETLVPQVPPVTARQHSCVPVMIDQGVLLMASPNPLVPDVEEDLRLRFGVPVRTVLTTPSKVNELVAALYPRDAPAPAPVAAAKGGGKASSAAAAEAEPARAAPTSRDEAVTQHLKYAAIVFSLTVMVVINLFVVLRGGFSYVQFTDFLLTFVLAAAAGGGTFAYAHAKGL